MCTAISYNGNSHYFGRNLDIEYSFDEKVIITPRCYTIEYKHLLPSKSHFAIIGTGIIVDDNPLYFDATNEAGLSIASLNFPDNVVYFNQKKDMHNVASFEVIPWILCQCKNIEESKTLLESANITDTPFSNDYPPTPLHWLISDESGSITVEPTSKGLEIYDNPADVLTNNPPFEMQIHNLTRYMQLSPYSPKNNFSADIEFTPYSRGMGAIGLPGDISSESRFVRACFAKENSIFNEPGIYEVNQFFHILGSVEQIRGCVRLGENVNEITAYSSCCDTKEGIYYYRTYDNFQLNAVSMHNEDLDGKSLISYPLIKVPQINIVN